MGRSPGAAESGLGLSSLNWKEQGRRVNACLGTCSLRQEDHCKFEP